jgi:hypothetical protein
VTLEQQAQYIGDAFRIIRDNWDFVEAAIVYNLRNKGTSPGDREGQMGLLYRDFSPKPSWEAFTTAMDDLAAPPAPTNPPAEPPAPLAPPPPSGGGEAVRAAEVPPPPPAAAPETEPEPGPALGRVRVRPRRFKAAKRNKVTVVYSLSAPARVMFTLERRGPGGRFVPVASFGRSGSAGRSSFRLGARPGGHRLRAGVYRLVAIPLGAPSGPGASRRASFRVLR